MKRLFCFALIFVCLTVFSANNELSIDDQKKLNTFFVLSGAMEKCHFYDAQFISPDKKHALCVLGCACDKDVRGHFNENFIKGLTSSDFTQTYEKIRLSVGDVINRLLSECKMKKDDQNRTLFAVALRIIYLGPEAMLSLWGSRPKPDCCTHFVTQDHQSFMFKPFFFEADEPKFKELDPQQIEKYAAEDNINAFIKEVLQQNPEHKVGVAVNFKAWKASQEKLGAAKGECLLL